MLKISRFYFIFFAIICPSVLPHARQEEKQVNTNTDCQMSSLLDVLNIYRALLSLEPSEEFMTTCCQSVSMTPHLDLLVIFGRHMYAWFQYASISIMKMLSDPSEVLCLPAGDITSMKKISQGADSSPRAPPPPPPPPSLPPPPQSASPPDPKSVTSLQLSHHHQQASSLEDDSRRRKFSSLITDPSLKKPSPPPVLSPPSRPVPSSAFDGIARAKIPEGDHASLAAHQDGSDTSNGRKVDPVSNRVESTALSMAKARPLPLFRLPPLKPSSSSPTTPASTPPASETTTTGSNSQPFVPEVTPKTSSAKTSKRCIGARRRRSHKKKKKNKKRRKQPTEKMTTALIEAPMRQVDGSPAVWLLVGCILGVTIITIWNWAQTYTMGISSQRNLNTSKSPSQESLCAVSFSQKPSDDSDKPWRILDTGQNLNRNDTVRKRPWTFRRSLLKRLKRSRPSEDSPFTYSSASVSNSNNFIGVDSKKVRILEDNFRKPRSLFGTESRRSRRKGKGKKYRKGKGQYFLERVQHQQSICPAAGLPWMMTYPNSLSQPLARAETTNSDSSPFSSDEQGQPPVDRVRLGMGSWEDSDEYSEAHSVNRAGSLSRSNCSSLRDELAGPWVSTSLSFVVYDLDVIDDIPDEVMEVLCCDQQPCDVHPHDRYHYVGNKIIVQRLPLPNDTNDRATSTTFLPHVDMPPHATASPRAESRPVSPDQKRSGRMPAQASKKRVRIVSAGSEDRLVDEICTDKPLHTVTDETVDQSVPNETVQITVTPRDDDSDTYDIDVGGSSVAKFFEAMDAGVPYKAAAKMVNAEINTDRLEVTDSFSQTAKNENLVSSAVNTIRLEYSDQTSQTAGENLTHAAVNTDHARLTDSTCQTSSVAAVDKGSNTEHLPATDSWCQTTETATSEASAQTSVEQQDGSSQTAEEEQQLPPLPPFSPRTPLVLTPASTWASGVKHVKNIIRETYEQCLNSQPKRKRRFSIPTEGQMDDSVKVTLDKIREIYEQCIRDGAMDHLGTSTDMTGYPFAIGAHRVTTSEQYAPWSICQTTKSPEIRPRKLCPASNGPQASPRPVPDKIQPTPTPPKRQLSQSNQIVVSPPRQAAHEKKAKPRSSRPTCKETEVSASPPWRSLNGVQKSATSPNSSATQVNQNIAHRQTRMETKRVCSLPDTPPKEPRDQSPSKPAKNDACIMKMFSKHFPREMTQTESGKNTQTGPETKIKPTRCTSQLPPGHGSDKPGLRKNDTTRTTPICTWAKPRFTGKSAEQSVDTRSSKCEVEATVSKRTQNKPEESATLPFCSDNRDDQSERQRDHPKHTLNCPETAEPIPEQRVSPDKIPSCKVNSDLLSELKEKLAERRSTLRLNEESDVTQVELESGTETEGETSSTLSLSSQEVKAQSQQPRMATSSSQPRVCIIPQWNRESRSSQRVCIIPQQKGTSTAPVEICITPKSPQKVCITPKWPHKIRITSEPIEVSQSMPKVSVCTQQKKDLKSPQRLSFIPHQRIIQTSPERLQAIPLQNSSVFKSIENTQLQGDVKPLAEVDSASYFQTTDDSCLQQDIRGKIMHPENSLTSHTLNLLPSRSPSVWGNVEQIFENQRKESTDCKKSQFVSVSKTIKDVYERCMAGKLKTTANTQPKHNQTVTSPTRPDSEQFQGDASLKSPVNSSANRADPNTFSARKLQTEENNNEVADKPIPVLPFVFPLGSDSKSGPGSAPPSDQDSSNSAERGSSEPVQAENSQPSSPRIESKEPYRSLSKVSVKESSPPWEVSDRARNNVFSPVGWISPRPGITSLFRAQSPSYSEKMDEDGEGVTHQDDADKWQILRVPSSESVSREKRAQGFEEDGVQPLQTSPQQQTYCPFRPVKDSPFYEFPATGMRSSVNRVIPLTNNDVHARHTAEVKKRREFSQETVCNPGTFTPIEHQPKIRGYSKLPLKSKVSDPRFSDITKVAFPSKPKPAQFLIQSSSDGVGPRSEETYCREKHFSEPSQSNCMATKTQESCGRGKQLRSIPLQVTRKTETTQRNKETFQRCEKSETLQSSARNDKVLPNERPKNPFSVTSGRHLLCQFPNAINEELQKKMIASQKPSEIKRRKRKREIPAVMRREISIKSHLSANDCNILRAAPQPKPRSRLPTSIPISRQQTCKEDYACNHGSLLNSDTHPETCTSSVEETIEKYSPEDDTKSDVKEPLILSLETIRPASDDGALLDIFQDKLNDNPEGPRLSRIPVLQMLQEEKQAMQPSNIRLNVDPKMSYSADIESKASESEKLNGTPGTRAISSGNAKADLNQRVEWSHNSETSTSTCKRITSKLPLPVNISSNLTNLLKTPKAVSPAISQRIQLLQRSISENRITVSRIMRPIRKLTTSCLDDDSAESSQQVKTGKTHGQEDHIPQGSKVPAADPTKRCNKRWPVKERSTRYTDQEDPYLRKPMSETLKYVRKLDREYDKFRKTTTQNFNKNDLSPESLPCSPAVESQASPGACSSSISILDVSAACSSSISILDVSAAQLITSTDEEVAESAILHNTSEQTSPSFMNSSTISHSHFRLTEELKRLAIKNGGHLYPSQVKRCPLLGSRQGDAEQLAVVSQFSAQTVHRETRLQKNSENRRNDAGRSDILSLNVNQQCNYSTKSPEWQKLSRSLPDLSTTKTFAQSGRRQSNANESTCELFKLVQALPNELSQTINEVCASDGDSLEELPEVSFLSTQCSKLGEGKSIDILHVISPPQVNSSLADDSVPLHHTVDSSSSNRSRLKSHKTYKTSTAALKLKDSIVKSPGGCFSSSSSNKTGPTLPRCDWTDTNAKAELPITGSQDIMSSSRVTSLSKKKDQTMKPVCDLHQVQGEEDAEKLQDVSRDLRFYGHSSFLELGFAWALQHTMKRISAKGDNVGTLNLNTWTTTESAADAMNNASF